MMNNSFIWLQKKTTSPELHFSLMDNRLIQIEYSEPLSATAIKVAYYYEVGTLAAMGGHLINCSAVTFDAVFKLCRKRC